MAEGGKVFDARGAADYLMLNEQTVRKLARKGRIPAFKIGASWRFKKDSLDRWARKQEESVRTPDVLVVDDEEAIRTLISEILRAKGYRVRTAPGGAKAVELFDERAPNLVILDMKMPGMDGPETFREIRVRDKNMPVIIFTGYPDSDLVNSALQYGSFTLLAKPADPERLIGTIRSVLSTESPRT